MKRREILVLLSGATIASLHAALHAQQKAMPVIGCLNATSPQHAPVMAAFRQGLNETGYVEGQNVAIDYRWAEGHFDRLPALAADLVGRKVDAIAAMDSLAAVRAAKSATSTTPIVFMGVSDPVGNGLVTSLARPGGNVTGISVMSAGPSPSLGGFSQRTFVGTRATGETRRYQTFPPPTRNGEVRPLELFLATPADGRVDQEADLRAEFLHVRAHHSRDSAESPWNMVASR